MLRLLNKGKVTNPVQEVSCEIYCSSEHRLIELTLQPGGNKLEWESCYVIFYADARTLAAPAWGRPTVRSCIEHSCLESRNIRR